MAWSGWPQMPTLLSVSSNAAWVEIGSTRSSRPVLRHLLRHRGRLLARALAAIMAPALAGREGRLSTLQPAGPAAEAIAGLSWALLAGAGVVFALVMLLLALALRPRAGRLEGRAEGLWLGGLGIAAPLVALGALLAWGLAVGERLSGSTAGSIPSTARIPGCGAGSRPPTTTTSG